MGARSVFIDGQEGTTGLKIHERLSGRPGIEMLSIDPALRKDLASRKALLNACDVAILCLPDAAAAEAVSLIENPAVRVIDASTAHRTAEGWAYGFPELSRGHREAVALADRISVPGCHATGFIAAVYPLVAAGALSPKARLACHSVTGYSGGGKQMIAAYEDAARPAALAGPRQYGLDLCHKHLPEMAARAGLAGAPVFTPIVCDFYAGMAVSVPLPAGTLNAPLGRDGLKALLSAHYAGQKFVIVEDPPRDGFLPATLWSGTNELHLYVLGNAEQQVLVSVFDNLGKGASGAAVQCMNIVLGLAEDEGL